MNVKNEKRTIGLPGGPSGPFYSVVTSTGRVVAMQIIEREDAKLIAAIPYLLKLYEQKKYGPYVGLTKTVTAPEFTLPGGRSRWFRYLFKGA